MKLARHSRYWRAIPKQVVAYIKAEDVPCGFFLSVQFTEADVEKVRVDRVLAAAKAATKESGRSVTAKFVDAQPRDSASRL